MLLPCRLKTRISTASSATNMRSSAMEYPTSGIVWSAPAVVGKSLDSVKPVTYARPFQLERLELSSPIVVELCRVDCPLLLKNLLDEVATVQVLDNQEIPGLRKPTLPAWWM